VSAGLLQALGGLGLFLLGMRVMTEALRELARGATRAALQRFTKSPWSGAATGTILTALVQSSSATTLAAVGFVGAGLLSFPEALGVVLGANVGTTVTGWLVAVLGFKLPLGQVAGPLCLAGMALRLSDSRGRRGALGGAIAGFGLVFVGIAAVQAGLVGLEGRFGPEHLPAASGLRGRVLLVLVGLGLTAITQSSSAGVATALASLHAGAIHYDQAASLVIGMDVGTTIASVLAALGGSANVRRTSAAHVVFNLLTMVGALVLLDPWIGLLDELRPGWIAAEPELALVAFHSSFNVVGALAVLPFARPFARLVQRLVPERRSSLVKAIDGALLDDPSLALAAARSSATEIARAALGGLERRLAGHEPDEGSAEELRLAVLELTEFLGRVPQPAQPAEAEALARRKGDLVHVLDHVERLGDRLTEVERARMVLREPALGPQGQRLASALAALHDPSRTPPLAELAAELAALAAALEAEETTGREAFVSRAATGVHTPAEALQRLDARRWLQRVALHAARIVAHLERAGG